MKLILHPQGELDHHHAALLRAEMDRKILKSGADTVVFDLSGITFMDSSGIGVLLGRYKLFAARKLFLTGANESVDRLLTMSGLYTLMPREEERA